MNKKILITRIRISERGLVLLFLERGLSVLSTQSLWTPLEKLYRCWSGTLYGFWMWKLDSFNGCDTNPMVVSIASHPIANTKTSEIHNSKYVRLLFMVQDLLDHYDYAYLHTHIYVLYIDRMKITKLP